MAKRYERHRITRTHKRTGRTDIISTIYWTKECAEAAAREYEEENPDYKCEAIRDMAALINV